MMHLVAEVYKDSNVIIRMYKGGISIADIALTYQVGPKLIEEVLTRFGVKVD